MGMPKMAIPILDKPEKILSFREQFGVYSKYYGFERVFITDQYVDVKTHNRETLMARHRVSAAMYERQLRAWGFLSQAFKIKTYVGRFRRSTSPRKFWEETLK